MFSGVLADRSVVNPSRLLAETDPFSVGAYSSHPRV